MGGIWKLESSHLTWKWSILIGSSCVIAPLGNSCMQAFTSQIFRNLVRSYMEIRYWLMRFSWPISQGFYVSTILKITIAKSTNELQARLMIHEEWKKISKLETFLGPADVEDLKKPWESRERRGQFGQIWRIEVEGFFSFPTGIKKTPMVF